MTGGALLIDAENLFYDYGLWYREDRFGYRKHLVAPGLQDAVQVVIVDRETLKARAEVALAACVVWAERISGRAMAPRHSYGKRTDPGVESVDGALAANGVIAIGVPAGKNEAEQRLIVDFGHLLATHDTFVFGGEDQLVRKAVRDHVAGHELRFAFIVPERNYGALHGASTTKALNAATTALLVDNPQFKVTLPPLLEEPFSRRRYYAPLCEVVVTTTLAAKADPAVPARRAPTDAPTGARAAEVVGNRWEKAAIWLIEHPPRRPDLDDVMTSPDWLLTHVRPRRGTPNRTDLVALSDRIRATFARYPRAAADWTTANVSDPGSGWRYKLAAALLVAEIVDDVPGRHEDDGRLGWAYRHAHSWIDSEVT